MKTIRSSILCLVVLLLAGPLLRAQDLSKYRHFTIGMDLNKVLQRTDQKIADVKVIHGQPALIQELTWWPPSLPGASYQADPVEQIHLSFYNAELYRISVTYDVSSTEGLTADDLVKSISAKYGPPTNLTFPLEPAKFDPYEVRQKTVASWEDAQYSLNLVRSSFTDGLGLTIYSKSINAAAELAAVQAVELEKQEAPTREAQRQKKKSDDLEAARQKNRKTFRP